MTERRSAFTLQEAEPGDSYRVVAEGLGTVTLRVLWGGVTYGKGPWDTTVEAKDPYGKSYEVTFGNRDRGHPAAYLLERQGGRRRHVITEAHGVSGDPLGGGL